jgi:hypothetical protein
MFAGSGQRRLEHAWAWLSLFTLVLCWDLSLRLDQRTSPPRVRIAHVLERENLSTERERGIPLRNAARIKTR